MAESTEPNRKVTTSDRIKDLILAGGLRPGARCRRSAQGPRPRNVRADRHRHAGTTNPDLKALVDEMVSMAAAGKTVPPQDRAFHTGLLAHLGNSLVGQLVAAFRDVHTAVLPKHDVAVAADLDRTARAHGLMLEAAESGDAEAFCAAITAHFEPIMRALEKS